MHTRKVAPDMVPLIFWTPIGSRKTKCGVVPSPETRNTGVSYVYNRTLHTYLRKFSSTLNSTRSNALLFAIGGVTAACTAFYYMNSRKADASFGYVEDCIGKYIFFVSWFVNHFLFRFALTSPRASPLPLGPHKVVAKLRPRRHQKRL